MLYCTLVHTVYECTYGYVLCGISNFFKLVKRLQDREVLEPLEILYLVANFNTFKEFVVWQIKILAYYVSRDVSIHPWKINLKSNEANSIDTYSVLYKNYMWKSKYSGNKMSTVC